MDKIISIVEIIVMITAIITHQSKTDRDIKMISASKSFYILLIFFTLIGIANLVIGEGNPLRLTHLDIGFALSVFYLGFLQFLKKSQKEEDSVKN